MLTGKNFEFLFQPLIFFAIFLLTEEKFAQLMTKYDKITYLYINKKNWLNKIFHQKRN